jgi:hypothetical protein
MLSFKTKNMADRFVSDDATCSTSMEQEEVSESPSNKKVTFRIPIPASTETLANLDRVNQLELAVNDLRQKLAAMHELLSRAIETNLLLKGRVPTYEPEVVQAAATAAGVTESSTSGAGGGTTITILRANGNKLVLKGKTFDVKDDLKRQFSAQWDASLKCWSCSDSFETQVREFLTARGFNVA